MSKTEESYETMLVPIIFGKLPIDIHINLAHEHGNSEWTITQLEDAILKEIGVLDSASFPLNKTLYEAHTQ